MSAPAVSRRCTTTGLRLVSDQEGRYYRIAKTTYGPTSAPVRAEGDAATWNRFDSPGATLYVAAEQETAFAEVLSPFKRQLGDDDPLQADADAVGMTREEFIEEVASQWREQDFQGVGAIPGEWRLERDIFQLEIAGGGWLIDVEHPDSLAALERRLEPALARLGVGSLTTAVLRGDDRRVTTLIGTALRRIVLDDDSVALGIEYGSKFGGGLCRALWLPDEDDDWRLDLILFSGEPIRATDEHMARACERFRIKVF